MATTTAPLNQASLIDLAKRNDYAPVQSTEKLWIRDPIHGRRWNELHPYQLLVVTPQGDGSYALLTPKPGQVAGGSWKFTLPVSPESFSISTPFAVTTSVTLGGFVEEWGGAPIKLIQISGTTGVFFGRDDAPASPPSISFAESIFAGTIANAQNTATAANDILSGPKPLINAVKNFDFDDGATADLAKTTGYYQFRLLQYFFEAYAELKKTIDGRQARLAFATWKDEAVYLCTPLNFDFRKDASSPLEYRYSINFKALKRVKLARGAADIVKTYVPVQKDPGKLAKMLATAERARGVLQSVKKTISAVGGDVERSLFEPLRELTLFAKDALSVPLSVADLADTLIQDTKAAILDLVSTRSVITGFGGNLDSRFGQVTANARTISLNAQSAAGESSDDGKFVRTDLLDPNSFLSTHQFFSAFEHPKDNFEFFRSINVGDLRLNPHTTAKIAAERARVRNLTSFDFETRRDNILATSAVFANAIGAGNSTYNATYNIQNPNIQSVAQPTDEDFEALYAMNDTVIEMNGLVVTNDNQPNSKLDAISAIAGMASRSGIAFTVPRSKFAVPFPYGSSLEQVAYRYLGDPNRWHEIAALNGLRSPWVDETGFDLPLLTNGADNQILVSDGSKLFVGQPVWLSSVAVTREQRRIVKIERLGPGQYLTTLDGNLDLDKYTTQANAVLQAFLPNTVNSQQIIYIPSQTDPKDGDFKTKSIPGVNEYDALISVGGVDLLLDQNNDLIITPDGGTMWAVGMVNIVQKVRLAVQTKIGTLMQHPSYGLPLSVGTSIADYSADEVKSAVEGLFANDPTFAGVVGAQVQINGPVTQLQMGVEVSGAQMVIPISMNVQR